MTTAIQDIPYKIPKQWDAAWFARFIRDVLANADVRNAVEGTGISISGSSDGPATIAASADVQNLLIQPFVLTSASGFLTNERTLAGESGVITITDGGANSTATVGIQNGGIALQKLQDVAGLAVIANPFETTGQLGPLLATAQYDVLHCVDVAGDLLLSFSAIDHNYISDFNEAAQDAVGTIFVDSSTIDFTYNDGVPSITAIVIDDSITYAKIQNVSTNLRVLGRITAGAGDVEELTGANLATIIGTNLGGNPTASVGLTAVNGSAGTYLRSDAAPALDQGIAPTWTSTHKWTDNDEVQLGTGGDLRLYHDGTDSFIRNDTGRTVFNIGADEAWYIDRNDGTTGITSKYRLRSSPGITIPTAITDSDPSIIIVRDKQQSIALVSAGSSISVGYRFITAGGTIASPSAVTVAGITYMSFLGAGGYDGTNWNPGSSALFGIKPAGTWSSTSRPTRLTLETTAVGSTSRVIRAQVEPTGEVLLSDGAAATPGLSFISDPDTGFYRIGANNPGLAVNGALLVDYSVNRVSYAAPVRLPNSTVAGLVAAGTAGAGALAFVTDATLTAITGLGVAVTGGGANKVPVYSDGTNWIII